MRIGSTLSRLHALVGALLIGQLAAGCGDDDAPSEQGRRDAGAGASGSAGASGQVLFSDDFEGQASAWVSVPGDGWAIVADGTNVYRQGTLDTLFRVASAGNVGWTDQIVEARVKVLAFTGQSTSYLAGIYGRFKDLDNHYYLAIQSDGNVKLKKKAGGSNASIGSSATGSSAAPKLSTDTWYTLKLEIVGTALKAYLDGTPVWTATDSDIASGGIALATKNATAQFDDVKVTAP